MDPDARSPRPGALGRLGRHLSALVAGQIVAAAALFALNILVARALGPGGYGEYALVLAVAAFGLMPFSWLASAALVFGQEDVARSGDASRTAGAVAAVSVPLVIVLVALWAAGHGAVESAFPALSGRWPQAFGWWALSVAFAAVTGTLQARKAFSLYAIFIAAVPVGALGATTLFLLGSASPSAALEGLVVGQAAVVAPMALWLARSLAPPRFERQAVRALAGYVTAWLPGTAQAYVVGQADVVVVAAVLDPVALGSYALATRLYKQLLLFADLLGTLALPLLNELRVSGRTERVLLYLDRQVPSTFAITVVACAMLSLGGQFLIPLVFGAGYAEAAAAFSVLMVALAIGAWRRLISPVVAAYRLIWEANAAGTVGAVAMVAAIVAFAPVGAAGPAAAVALGAVIETAVVLRLTHRTLGGATPTRVWASVAAAAILVPVPAVINGSAAVAVVIVLVLAYAAVVRALRLVSTSDVDEIVGRTPVVRQVMDMFASPAR